MLLCCSAALCAHINSKHIKGWNQLTLCRMQIPHRPLFNLVFIVLFPCCCCFFFFCSLSLDFLSLVFFYLFIYLPEPEVFFSPPAALWAEFSSFDNSPSLHPPASMCLCFSPPCMRLCCSQQLGHMPGFDSVACSTEPELVYFLSDSERWLSTHSRSSLCLQVVLYALCDSNNKTRMNMKSHPPHHQLPLPPHPLPLPILQSAGSPRHSWRWTQREVRKLCTKTTVVAKSWDSAYEK